MIYLGWELGLKTNLISVIKEMEITIKICFYIQIHQSHFSLIKLTIVTKYLELHQSLMPVQFQNVMMV